MTFLPLCVAELELSVIEGVSVYVSDDWREIRDIGPLGGINASCRPAISHADRRRRLCGMAAAACSSATT